MRQAVLDQLAEPLTPAEEAAVQIAMQLQEVQKDYAVLYAAAMKVVDSSTIKEVDHVGMD